MNRVVIHDKASGQVNLLIRACDKLAQNLNADVHLNRFYFPGDEVRANISVNGTKYVVVAGDGYYEVWKMDQRTSYIAKTRVSYESFAGGTFLPIAIGL